LALAEGRDRQPREVAHRAVRTVSERRGDLLAQRLQVYLRLALAAAAASLGDPPPSGLRLGCAEEEAVEDQLEHAPVLRGLGQRRRDRLLEVRLV